MKETEAARSVLLEVLNALGAMRDDLVIVGGWVPDLLYPSSNHMGSLDVDLAVSPKAIGGRRFPTLPNLCVTFAFFAVILDCVDDRAKAFGRGAVARTVACYTGGNGKIETVDYPSYL